MLIYVIESTITISLVEYNELKLLVSGIPELVKTIESLREEVRLLRNGRDSGTSHTPPSHQLGRANAKSLRVKTGRRPGGQHGHEGSTLQIKEVPDETVDYIPQYCNGCGGGLQQSAAVLGQRRQEAVLPPV